MDKTTIALGAMALGLLGARGAERDGPTLLLKEEAMFVEYTATSEEAVVVVEAEAEYRLGRVELRGPQGERMLDMRSSHGLAFSGISLETEERDLRALLERYPAGRYDLVGRTVDGHPVRGRAVLRHDLLPPPVVTYPPQGAVEVPTEDLEVRWASHPASTAYSLVLEQDDNDGLTVRLPAGSESFQVPPGFLRAGTETQLEVGAVGANGNCTLVEVTFRTR